MVHLERGNLTCCDNCFRGFDRNCLKERDEKLPKKNATWMCSFCQTSAKDKCLVCENNIKASELKIQCSLCNIMLHPACTRVPLVNLVENPFNKYFVVEWETRKEIKVLRQNNKDPKDLEKKVEILLKNHLATKGERLVLYHVCHLCFRMKGVDSILRASARDEDSDFLLVKLNCVAHIHSFWMPDNIVEDVAMKKVKNFRDRQEQDEDPDEDVDTGKMIPEGQPEGDDAAAEDNEDEEDFFRHTQIEKILKCRKPISKSRMTYSQILQEFMDSKARGKIVYGAQDNFRFLVKWEGLEYNKTTWEDEFIVNFFEDRWRKFFLGKKEEEKLSAEFNKGTLTKFLTPRQITLEASVIDQLLNGGKPAFLIDRELFDYQKEGLVWLIKKWQQKTNVILADEMGLGKTIQTICLLAFLYNSMDIRRPFLIVAPNSTLYNWAKEFATWAPDFNIVVYTGSDESRDKIRTLDFFFNLHDKKKKNGDSDAPQICKFNALITSYEMLMRDAKIMRKIEWQEIVIDEAQRLKNAESKFYTELQSINSVHKILLTGTPIQNSLEELLNLVEFISPAKAAELARNEHVKKLMNLNKPLKILKNDQPVSTSEISEVDRKIAFEAFQSILSPHILRRTKDDINLQLPDLDEWIIPLDMTTAQKQMYKGVLLKNFNYLLQNEQSSSRTTKFVPRCMINVLLALRFVSNHPMLMDKRAVEDVPQGEKFRKDFIMNSNKMKFLERILMRLLPKKHKILIFSQFVLMLDILEEFCNYKKLTFERLDGQVPALERQKAIESFNSQTSKTPIFLLSTRSGGLGINLTAADTVILFDSDFNPYRDIQAVSRAHRIGQQRKVNIFRLVSKGSVEEKIIENAKKKLVLGNLVETASTNTTATGQIAGTAAGVGTGQETTDMATKMTSEELEHLLRHGVTELSKDTTDDITDDQLEAFLASNESGKTASVQGFKVTKDSKKDLTEFYLNGFKFSSNDLFNSEGKEAGSAGQEEKNDKAADAAGFWSNVLGTEYDETRRKEDEALGKGKRVRKQIQTGQQVPHDLPEFEVLINSNQTDDFSSSDSEYAPTYRDKPTGEGGQPAQPGESGTTSKASGAMIPEKEPKEKSEAELERQRKKEETVSKRREERQKILNFLNESLEGNDIKALTSEQFMTSTCGLNEMQRCDFLAFVLKYGIDFENLSSLYDK